MPNFSQQEKTKAFLEKHLLLCATPMIEYLKVNEQFSYDDYQEKINELCFVPDLEATLEYYTDRDCYWVISPDNPLESSSEFFSEEIDSDYYILKFEQLTDPAPTEKQAFLIYARCKDEHLYPPHDYFVKYQDQYCFIRNVEKIASGDSLEEMLESAWYQVEEQPFLKPSEYYIVSPYFAQKLEAYKQPITLIFGWWIWGRLDNSSSFYHDQVVQEIAADVEQGEIVENLKLRLQSLVSGCQYISQAFVKELALATINDGYAYNRLKALDFQWQKKAKDLDWLDQQLSHFTILAIRRYVSRHYSPGTDWTEVCNQEDIEALKLRILEYYTFPGEELFFC